MAILLVNADGTVYHRYGGRSDVSPMNIETLTEILQQGLITHDVYQANQKPIRRKPALPVDELVNKRMQRRMNPVFGCIHCHYVGEAKQYVAMESGNWTPDQFWVWPRSERLGLVMDQNHQYVVQSVQDHSSAQKAGIQKGDHLLTLNEARILTKYDIQWILENSPNKAIQLPFTVSRNDHIIRGILNLEDAWKVGDPDEYGWRIRNVFTAHMAKFLPTPGLVGQQLSKKELKKAKLPEKTFGLRVTRLNQGAYLAGIRMGDIILSAGHRSDFGDKRDFFRWCEILRRSGRDIQILLQRDETQLQLMATREHLNYRQVEMAPEVDVGFIIQELAADRGLRVGNVYKDSGADRCGLIVGDRIQGVDGETVSYYDELQDILNRKSPGDLLRISVLREGKGMEFSYVLPEKKIRQTRVATLSKKVERTDQEIVCSVMIDLPKDNHIYSMHQEGFGTPTRIEFKGSGYQLLGTTSEPIPRKVDGGIDSMWIHEGKVKFKQRIRIIDPNDFFLLLSIYAQICDESHCHEFRSVLFNNGASETFFEFQGNPELYPAALEIQ
jgi:membrane-associated protease RseP (regulator of RpoE activity)